MCAMRDMGTVVTNQMIIRFSERTSYFSVVKKLELKDNVLINEVNKVC